MKATLLNLARTRCQLDDIESLLPEAEKFGEDLTETKKQLKHFLWVLLDSISNTDWEQLIQEQRTSPDLSYVHLLFSTVSLCVVVAYMFVFGSLKVCIYTQMHYYSSCCCYCCCYYYYYYYCCCCCSYYGCYGCYGYYCLLLSARSIE